MIICRHKRRRQEKRRTRIAILSALITQGKENRRGVNPTLCA